MSTNIDAESAPRPISTLDLRSLELLRAQFEEMQNNDVRALRGESIAVRLETARQLRDKVAQRLGDMASGTELVIGIVMVDPEEHNLLEEARRMQPPEKRLY
jgi:hypothetical protein